MKGQRKLYLNEGFVCEDNTFRYCKKSQCFKNDGIQGAER